jgi:hypothetical protein
VKNHYELLGVVHGAPSEEIKRAFRREIARYHPDKVQHLGPEFQEIAATRAAELTEAYRVLMDAASRRQYDGELESAGVETLHPPPAASPSAARAAEQAAEPQPRPGAPAAEPLPRSHVERQFHQDRATTNDFVRKAAIAKLRDALMALAGSATPVTAGGFDAAYLIKPRKQLFKKADPQVRLLARFLPHVDAAAVEEVWPFALKSGGLDGVICLMLLGTSVAPARELGAAVAELRRKTRTGAPIIVPVDVRDWEALFPPEAPDIARQVVQRLKSGS